MLEVVKPTCTSSMDRSFRNLRTCIHISIGVTLQAVLHQATDMSKLTRS